MSCCPKGSWEQLNAEYHPIGEDLNVDGVPVYHTGKGNPRVLIIFSDIFGATSGRHRSVADIFASLHYEVFLP
jgi:dienelactone hydrolase